MKDCKFVVTVCCQGQPFYYFYRTLFGAMFGFVKIYLKSKSYNTMRFSLDELYETDKAYKVYLKKMEEAEEKLKEIK